MIEPFKEYPELMEWLLGEVKTQQQKTFRMELLRVLGILGALDPDVYGSNSAKVTASQ